MCKNPNCILESCSVVYGECHCGCGGETNICKQNSYTLPLKFKNHPLLYIKYHVRLKSPVEYVVDEETGCWEWQRGKTNGYGRMKVDGKPIPAQRVYYEKYKGPIPEGLVIDHLCRNHGCVNPEHLEAVTVAENARRGSAKLNWVLVRFIRDNKNLVPAKELAEIVGVNRSMITRIWSNKLWVDKSGE